MLFVVHIKLLNEGLRGEELRLLEIFSELLSKIKLWQFGPCNKNRINCKLFWSCIFSSVSRNCFKDLLERLVRRICLLDSEFIVLVDFKKSNIFSCDLKIVFIELMRLSYLNFVILSQRIQISSSHFQLAYLANAFWYFGSANRCQHLFKFLILKSSYFHIINYPIDIWKSWLL